jgi:hypothetical protein
MRFQYAAKTGEKLSGNLSGAEWAENREMQFTPETRTTRRIGLGGDEVLKEQGKDFVVLGEACPLRGRASPLRRIGDALEFNRESQRTETEVQRKEKIL